MSLRLYRTFQALILAILGLYLLSKIIDGRILLYINQRFIILVLLAAVALLGLAQVVMRARPHPDQKPEDEAHAEHSGGRAGWALWLIALPVLMGVLLPERPLGASALERRGINTTTGLSARPGSATNAFAIPAAQRSVLDWVRISSDGGLVPGEMADVSGFVYHDARLEDGQFLVGRFTIACCVADAMAVGMVVAWPEAAKLPDNRWVRVRGPVESMDWEGRSLPVIVASQVELIPEPGQPYLFP